MPAMKDPTGDAGRPVHKRGLTWNTGRFIVSAVIALVVAAILSVLALGISAGGVGNGDMSYTSLDYDTQVLKNGDLRIKQRINIRLGHREDDCNG